MKDTATTGKITRTTTLTLTGIVCGDCPVASYEPEIDKELYVCGLSYEEGRPVNPRRVIFIPTMNSKPRYSCPLKWNRELARQFFPQLFSPSRPKGIC